VRRVLLGLGAGVLVVVAAVTAWVVAPFIFPSQTGSSGQAFITDGYPTMMSATGDDTRTRTIRVTGPDGGEVSLDRLTEGDRLIVIGDGFDSSRGIYVALCRVPDVVDVRPGPCLGGVPELDEKPGERGAVEWAPSNWINQEWAWRLFGARSYDDPRTGSFTAYLVVPAAVEEEVNCLTDQCGIYTRNDHTAIDNRMQDLYVRVEFAQ
jgi:hypothetical protein